MHQKKLIFLCYIDLNLFSQKPVSATIWEKIIRNYWTLTLRQSLGHSQILFVIGFTRLCSYYIFRVSINGESVIFFEWFRVSRIVRVNRIARNAKIDRVARTEMILSYLNKGLVFILSLTNSHLVSSDWWNCLSSFLLWLICEAVALEIDWFPLSRTWIHYFYTK